jgi:hypothetical protein
MVTLAPVSLRAKLGSRFVGFGNCEPRQLLRQRIPSVIESWLNDSSMLARWTHSRLSTTDGNLIVPLAIGPRLQSSWTKVTLAEALSSFDLNDAVQRYVRQMPIPPTMVPDVEALGVRSIAPGDRHLIFNLWIGPSGTLQPFHKDNHNRKAVLHGLLLQLFGKKEILAVSSEFDRCMYRLNAGPNGHYSEVDLDADCNRFPLFEQAHVHRVILSPGDLAYMPPDTWHRVESQTPSVSLSCWWHEDKVMDRFFAVSSGASLESELSPITPCDIEAFGGAAELVAALRQVSPSAIVGFLQSCDFGARASLLAQAELAATSG